MQYLIQGQEWGYLMRCQARGSYTKLMALVPKMMVACLFMNQNDYMRVNIYRQWQHNYWVDNKLPFPDLFNNEIQLLYEETGERTLGALRRTMENFTAGNLKTAAEVVTKLDSDFREIGASRARKQDDPLFDNAGKTAITNGRPTSAASQERVNTIRAYLLALLRDAKVGKLKGFTHGKEYYSKSVVMEDDLLQNLSVQHIAHLIPNAPAMLDSCRNQISGILTRYRDRGEEIRIADFRSIYDLVAGVIAEEGPAMFGDAGEQSDDDEQ